ncbi:MAG: monovalent cation/H+ antiporter complex subunit F [Pseudomonadales bacterium]
MSAVLLSMAMFLLLLLLGSMYRVLRGPSDADRMMAAQLYGTTAVAILLLLSFALEAPALIDVALVMALLAAIATIAFVRDGTGAGASDDT